MNTQEGSADPRARIGAIVIEAIRVAEAEVGMSIWEYRARRDMPAGLKWDMDARLNAIFCFQSLKCGRWQPRNWFFRPLGCRMRPPGPWRPEHETAPADHLAVHFPTDPHEFVNVWSFIGRYQLYLYNDDTPASLKGYYLRLARWRAAMDPWRTAGDAPGCVSN